MNFMTTDDYECEAGGICIWLEYTLSRARSADQCLDWLADRGLANFVDVGVSVVGTRTAIRFRLTKPKTDQWTPDGDTLELASRVALEMPCGVETEILLAMLAGPVAFEYPSLAELESSVRIRSNIVEAARKTFLAFAAYEAERPADYWEYDIDRGFVVRPGKSLLQALRLATQPAEGERAYSFSCYRATEYVVALALAEEASRCNPELFKKLQRQAEIRAIKAAEFHSVFMKEYGTKRNPLPPKYYVPGDRVWFRNPDEYSSDATGFEGSWVFYLGGGLFTDFWKRNRTFTLQAKCLEIYHWRHAAYRAANGRLQIDERVVQACVEETCQDAAKMEKILAAMEKLQDPHGVYASGGCIDPTREYPRWVRPGTTDIVLPDVAVPRLKLA